MRDDFDSHMRELRRARDEEEFNRFMDAREKARKRPRENLYQKFLVTRPKPIPCRLLAGTHHLPQRGNS